MIVSIKLENLLTGAPPSNVIPMERNPVYGAGPQPPTAATGGDGVVTLENPAYSLPTDLQLPPGPQPPTATTVCGDGQQNHDVEYESLN